MNLLKGTTAQLKYQFKQGSLILVGSLVLANFVNFVFNAYLGRVLETDNFGLVTLINTLLSMLMVFITAFASTVNHRSSFLSTHQSVEAAFSFFFRTRRILVTTALAITLGWLISIPFLSRFFNIADITSLLSFTPVIILGLFAGIHRGILQSQILFRLISVLVIGEAVSKLFFALVIIGFNLERFVYLSIPLSIMFSFLLSIWFLYTQSKKLRMNTGGGFEYRFPNRFFLSAFIMGISTSGFLTVDLVLVKHFLLPASAGEYALLALAGKMIFFFGSLLSGFIITFVSRDLGKGSNPNPTFYKLLGLSIFLTSISYLGIGVLGNIFVPFLLGEKTLSIVPYLPMYGLAIAFFTISNCFVLYHLARHHFTFSIITMISVSLMILGVSFNHQTIHQIVQVIFFVSLFNFSVIFTLHLMQRNGKFILRALIDLVDLFNFSSKEDASSEGKKRILIFNWRDTCHKFSGGAEVYIRELSKRWVKEGYSVTLFCGNDGNCARNEVIEGVQVIRRGGFYFVYIWAFWYYILKFRGKFDVIIDCQNGIPFFMPLYAKEKVYCLMFHVHQEVFIKSLPLIPALFAQILENRFMPWAYRYTPFITISPSSKEEIEALDLGNAGIEIVYPGIDVNKYGAATRKNRKPLILYVGRLQYYKSVDLLIRATKKIVKNIPQVEVVIAGDGEKKQELESLAVSLGVNEKIVFLGKVSEQKKVELYKKAWVFVNPSLKEGWGITSIEANAAGTPVVASNVPGLKDSVNNPDTGELVSYGDVDALANKVIQLVKNDNRRFSMKQKCIEWAKRFDWSISAKKTLSILKV